MEEQIVSLVKAAMSGDEQATAQIQEIMKAAEQGDGKAQQIAQMIQQVAQQLQGSAEGSAQAMKRGGKASKKKIKKGSKGLCPCQLHRVGGRIVEVDGCTGLPIHKSGGQLIKKYQTAPGGITYNDYNGKDGYTYRQQLVNGKYVWTRQKPTGYDANKAFNLQDGRLQSGLQYDDNAWENVSTNDRGSYIIPKEVISQYKQNLWNQWNSTLGDRTYALADRLQKSGWNINQTSDGKTYIIDQNGRRFYTMDQEGKGRIWDPSAQKWGTYTSNGFLSMGGGSEWKGDDYALTWDSDAPAQNQSAAPAQPAAPVRSGGQQQGGLFSGLGLSDISLRGRQQWVRDNADYLRSQGWTDDEINGYRGQTAGINYKLRDAIKGAGQHYSDMRARAEELRNSTEELKPANYGFDTSDQPTPAALALKIPFGTSGSNTQSTNGGPQIDMNRLSVDQKSGFMPAAVVGDDFYHLTKNGALAKISSTDLRPGEAAIKRAYGTNSALTNQQLMMAAYDGGMSYMNDEDRQRWRGLDLAYQRDQANLNAVKAQAEEKRRTDLGRRLYMKRHMPQFNLTDDVLNNTEFNYANYLQ